MRSSISLALPFALILSLHASVIGVSKPAQSLTVERINATLPRNQRAAWLDYLKRSEAQMAADKAVLAVERKGLATIPSLPRQSFSARSIPLHRAPVFYSSAEAKHIGDVILSFQTPAGGWSKNLDMAGEPRQAGQSYATANLAPIASSPGDFDQPRDETWHYVGTLDNDATNTELHFLAELSAALPGHDGDIYRASFLRGLNYLLAAQFPNGGWPQVWPLEGGYHDAITFNDDAVTESTGLLTLVVSGQRVTSQPDEDEIAFTRMIAQRTGRQLPEPQASTEDYTFVPAALRARAQKAANKALACILATQVHELGPAGKGEGKHLTIWSQQNDPLTLAPVAARNFEPAALSSTESASVMEYLMSLPNPSSAVVRSVDAAATWFQAHKIMGYNYEGGRNTPGGRKLVAKPGAGPIWSRFYSLSTGKPIFGDRDKTIHDDVNDLSLERRNGYGWYGSSPQKALTEYANWKKSRAS
ncbi:MAG TPA: pectate lyase [Acidobacteriaceae bacterium]|nr:pectate lyase [Acidobacteriaceae bacterium]